MGSEGMVFPLFARTQILNSLLPSCPFQPGITSAICPPPPLPIFLFFLFFLLHFSLLHLLCSSSSFSPPPTSRCSFRALFLNLYSLVAFTRLWNISHVSGEYPCISDKKRREEDSGRVFGSCKAKKKKPAFYIFNHIT